ncbi:alpha/beta fold hydrolase [Arthrobacter mobilis]|uniref:Alpha/beta hydrolase n=1 Tax=Arthrobacter mobilis TaxID=2724944 RepID=A0A7X6K6A1_9MICC|nr:alpha/beta fold hydrolase [Arthrobacter mobilis]NKX55404.1 alpha/beta hydrolase [Arthrobacter mobilis]
MGPIHRSTLIFIHGGGVGPWMWADQAAFFSGEHRVHTPVLPGHDPRRPEEFTTHAAAAHSVAGQTALQEAGGRVTVVGFSLGGQTAIQLAAAYPEKVDRPVVVSSLLEPRRGAPVLAALAAAAAPLSGSRLFTRAQARQLLIPAERFEDYYAL